MSKRKESAARSAHGHSHSGGGSGQAEDRYLNCVDRLLQRNNVALGKDAREWLVQLTARVCAASTSFFPLTSQII